MRISDWSSDVCSFDLICAESPLNSVDVCVKCIGRKLDAICQPLRKVSHESHRMWARPLPNAVGWNQLCGGVDCNERPHIANTRTIILLPDVALLLLNVGPDFVDLDALARKVAHFFVHQLGAAVAHLHHKPHDGVAVRVG